MNGILRTGLMVLAGAGLIAQSAYANTSYGQGDLILGVRNGTTGNDYEVDLGNYSLFTAGVSFTLPGVSIADLSGQYGAGWNTSNALRWAVGGFQDGGALGTTIFTTKSRGNTTGVQSVPWANETGAEGNNIQSELASLGARYNNQVPTANSSTAIFVSASDPDSYLSHIQTAGKWNGNFQGSVENNFVLAGTDRVSDLYAVLPTGSGQATYLGYFTFGASGATFTAVPEPGVLACLGSGLLTLLFRNQLRRNRV